MPLYQAPITGYLTSANIVSTITDGATTTAPNENAVYDALKLKITKGKVYAYKNSNYN